MTTKFAGTDDLAQWQCWSKLYGGADARFDNRKSRINALGQQTASYGDANQS